MVHCGTMLCKVLVNIILQAAALPSLSCLSNSSLNCSEIKIPAEVKRMSTDISTGETVLHKAARLGYLVGINWMFLKIIYFTALELVIFKIATYTFCIRM